MMKHLLINAALGLSLMSLIPLPAIAAPAYQVISHEAAMQSAVEVQVGPGRSTLVKLTSASRMFC
ncbi:MAG: hypothetical protein KME42_00395 [Tildeniella nuda ZEHNDER 1965/U140]|jgi:hypothetical protein|nr:hypothetical protein [Tildeniella nuda ZEHNDER 1965/U140]